jgi:preprotein translocase subunit SecG
MFVFLLVVFVIVCLLLGLFILVQSDTGGGISGAVGGGLSGANSAIGAQNTENILTRGTAVLAVVYFVLALSLFVMSANMSGPTVNIEEHLQNQQQMQPGNEGMGLVNPEAEQEELITPVEPEAEENAEQSSPENPEE